MVLEQFYLGCLAHASYLVASNGEAAIIDPQRDVEIYLEAAKRLGVKIRHIFETHLHADFVSGHLELASRTGANIYLGAEANAQFPHVDARQGDRIPCGDLVFEVLETPGHTVESICIVMHEANGPSAVFTGDTLFVGDVGRPDLAPDKTPQELAALLYDSLHQKLMTLPEDVKVYPAHGAGSLCGKQMSTDKFSTIGREKLSNYALRAASKEEFVTLLTADLPARPEYFRHEVELNRHGAQSVEDLPSLDRLSPQEVLALQQQGAVVLDTRSVMEYGVAHIPGSVHIALSGQFASWAARLLGLQQQIVLTGEDEAKIHEARVRLARVGIENVAGYLFDGISSWVFRGFPIEYVPQVSVDELAEWIEQKHEQMTILDVREPGERSAGALHGSIGIPLGTLPSRLTELERDRWLFVHCKGGFRSSIATSLLRRAGFDKAVNITGGYDAWLKRRTVEEGSPV